jgi:RimJ/RimL family protein N-acetyltransferase
LCGGALYDLRIAVAIPFPDPQLRGPTFALRPFRPDDFERAVAFADPSSEPWVQPLPAGDATAVAEFFEEHRIAGEMLQLVIAASDDERYLGEVMLNVGEDNVGELGCGIVEGARGRGIATQALRLLADWSLASLGLGRVQVIVARENTAALRLAERAGFQREGVLRSYREHDGVRFDTVMLSRLPDDIARH